MKTISFHSGVILVMLQVLTKWWFYERSGNMHYYLFNP